MDIRKKFFTVGLVMLWNRLPRVVVNVPEDVKGETGRDSEHPGLAVDVPAQHREVGIELPSQTILCFCFCMVLWIGWTILMTTLSFICSQLRYINSCSTLLSKSISFIISINIYRSYLLMSPLSIC